MKKIVIILIIVITVILYFVLNPFEKPNDYQDKSVRTSTSPVKRGNLIVAVNSNGIVEPILTVELKSKASGEIIELSIEEGDFVKKGQLIARLDAATAENDFNQAKADVEVARVALSQAKKQAEQNETQAFGNTPQEASDAYIRVNSLPENDTSTFKLAV